MKLYYVHGEIGTDKRKNQTERLAKKKRES
jgi:hypothetical protein